MNRQFLSLIQLKLFRHYLTTTLELTFWTKNILCVPSFGHFGLEVLFPSELRKEEEEVDGWFAHNKMSHRESVIHSKVRF